MSRDTIRATVLVASAAMLQVVLWQANRWLGFHVHGYVQGAPIPEWYMTLDPPFWSLITVAPAFIVGWFAPRHGVALGVLATSLATVTNRGFATARGVWDWSPWFLSDAVALWHLFISVLAVAILGVVSAAAGAYFRSKHEA